MTISTLKSSDRRVCDRVAHTRKVAIKLGEKLWVNGRTSDISLGGVNVTIEDELNQQWLEQSALLYIKDGNDELSPEFPCTIVRIDAQSLCLQLDRKKAAQFGILLTRKIFKRRSSL